MARPFEDPDKNFDAKIVRSDGCWGWTASKSAHGYGMFSARGVKTSAHRYAWQRANGPIPPGMNVCHHCDNPSCSNPAHLFLGTALDNVQDMIRKGRASFRSPPLKRGEGQPTAVLTDETVRVARTECARGASIASMARRFGVTRSTMSVAVHRITWAHVE